MGNLLSAGGLPVCVCVCVCVFVICTIYEG